MEYLINLNGRYYFNRRVPGELSEYDSRKLIRFALKTDSHKEAVRLAGIHNQNLESYWKELVQTGKKYSQSAYETVVKRARLWGFSYMPLNQIAELAIEDIVKRLLHVKHENLNKTHVEAVLGGVDLPKITIKDALNKYWDYSTEKILSKSENQLRKWKRPRERAVENFIKVIGNKDITEITREDLLKFKDWWLYRMYNENLVANNANKNLIQLKVILDTVSENLNLKLDIESLFRKLLIKEDNDSSRLPLDTDFIKGTLLSEKNLQGLNRQAKWALFAVAETGAGLSELVGLTKEDILLDCEIPHIIIKPQSKHLLKTKYRKRIIPLVGYALDAFKACPSGFTDYVGRPDSLSTALGKYLRENDLLPSPKHSVYSLRHSFQDRLLAVNAPDRVQADLMGHKFNRQAYGQGATLENKRYWINQIRLKRREFTN